MRASFIVGLAFFAAVNAAVSRNGRCGSEGNGATCVGSQFGSCCSRYGWCGSTNNHCGGGCQGAFGICPGTPSSSTRVVSSSSIRVVSTPLSSTVRSSSTSTRPATPSSTQRVSTNGRCGANFGGQTCVGYYEGECCSQYSYCGASTGHCSTGCQPGYGRCTGLLSSSSRSSVRSSTTVTSRSSSSLTALVSTATPSRSSSTLVVVPSSTPTPSPSPSLSSSSLLSSSTPAPTPTPTPTSTPTPQLVKNPSFEDGLSPWFLVARTSDPNVTGVNPNNPHTGQSAFQAGGILDDWEVAVAQYVDVDLASGYILELWSSQNIANNCVGSVELGMTYTRFTPPLNQYGVTRLTVPAGSITAGRNVIALYFNCLSSGTAGEARAWYDDITLRPL